MTPICFIYSFSLRLMSAGVNRCQYDKMAKTGFTNRPSNQNIQNFLSLFVSFSTSIYLFIHLPLRTSHESMQEHLIPA